MPTLRQRRVAKRVVEALNNNEDISGGALLKSVDYGTGLQRSPGRVLESEGFKEALSELIDVDEIDNVVKSIMHNGEDHNRLKAGDMLYKRAGAYAAEKKMNLNVNADIDVKDADAIALVEEYEAKLLEKYIGRED